MSRESIECREPRLLVSIECLAVVVLDACAQTMRELGSNQDSDIDN